MGFRSFCPLLLLLILASSQNYIAADARPLPLFNQEKYVKVLTTLGMMCQCCDGPGGECRSQWDSSCGKLDCRPWKFF